MHIVLDTNQIWKLSEPDQIRTKVSGFRGISVAPFVIAEILLRSDPEPAKARLRKFPLRYGLETTDAFERMALMSESEIVAFEPFLQTGDLVNAHDFYLFLKHPCAGQVEQARFVKNENRQFCASMAGKAQQLRKNFRDKGTQTPRFADIAHMLSETRSFQRALIFESISNGSKRSVSLSNEELYQAVMQNQYLARFFKTLLYYIVGWSRWWADQVHNFDPSGNEDDWTDITLPLYAADGDVIATADQRLVNAVRMIEPSKLVTTKTAVDIA